MNLLAACRHYFPDRNRRRALLALALPIIGGMASQNILNLVDIGMVGQLGTTALAATGLGSFANWLSMAFILGLATGVQAICSRRVGEDAHGEIAVPLNGGLMLALILGLPMAGVLIWLAPGLLAIINPDPDVVAEAGPYLQVRLLALIAVGMNFSFRGYWSAVHRTGLYLATLLIMHMVNIFLNWVFIFGNLGAPELGVTGAGLATTLSIWLGTLIYFGFGIRHAWDEGFLHRRPTFTMLARQMRLSLPSSFQQLFFAGGMMALIAIIGLIGTRELAAANVLLTLGLVIVLPSIGLGIATATLVGNALGRGNIDDARRWAWNAALFTGAVSGLMGLGVIVLGRPILAVFLTDPATLELAYWPLIISGLIIGVDTAGLVLMHGLLGAGDTGRVMKISITAQWALFLPLAVLAGPVLGGGLLVVWILQAIYRMGQTVWFARAWRAGHWQKIRI
ncbi:MAG: MATE family efflux transporter [Wenzhouxiangellaceae bacterium]|nr:MATE family efflux transporter [Wenzhouxiangellaceae bacterium]